MTVTSNIRPSSRHRSNGSFVTWGRGLLAVVSLVAGQHAFAHETSSGNSDKTYRCVVLGNSDACPAPSAQSPVQIEERVEPGPIAKYYLHLGMDREAAMEKARAQGEVPTRLVVRVTTVALTDKEKYDNFLGNVPHRKTIEQVVVVGPTERPKAAAVGAENTGG